MPGKHNKVAVKIGKPDKNEKDSDKEFMEVETALQLIRQVGDQFCDLYHQEKEAAHDHMTEGTFKGFEFSGSLSLPLFDFTF